MGWLIILAFLMQGCEAHPQTAMTLHALDHTRAVAFQHADLAMLSDVYAPDSDLLSIERQRMVGYSRAGFRLRGGEMSITSCRVLRDTKDRRVVRVTDRLLATTAVYADGHERRLPTDKPTRRVIEMHRISGRWLIWSVRPG